MCVYTHVLLLLPATEWCSPPCFSGLCSAGIMDDQKHFPSTHLLANDTGNEHQDDFITVHCA